MHPPLIREEGGVLVITLEDPASVNESQSFGLRQVLYSAVEAREAPRVALDLGALDHISSTGIALLVGLKRRIETRAGRLVLFRLRDEVHDLFVVMKLVGLLNIVGDREKAIEFLRSSPED